MTCPKQKKQRHVRNANLKLESTSTSVLQTRNGEAIPHPCCKLEAGRQRIHPTTRNKSEFASKGAELVNQSTDIENDAVEADRTRIGTKLVT